MKKLLSDIVLFIGLACVAVILLGAVFASPRVMAPDSLRRVKLEGVTREQAEIALTVSEASLNDSQTGLNYVGQYKTLAETGHIVAMAFYTIAVALACLSVPAIAFFIVFKGFSTYAMYGGGR